MESVNTNPSNRSTTTDSQTETKRESQWLTAALQGSDMGNGRNSISTTKSWGKQEIMEYSWVILLGFAGLVDVLGTILPDLATSNGTCSLEDEQCEITNPGSILLHWQSFVAWLDRHDIPISFVFSALWFLDAFWTANKARLHAREVKEMERLNMSKEAKPVHWWQNPQSAYFWSISLQLLCLPTGFYGALFFAFRKIAAGGTIHDLEQIENEVLDVVEMGDDGMKHHKQFSVRSKKAFIFVIIQHFAGRTTRSTVKHAKSKAIALVKKLSKQIFSKAIRNPRKFRRQVKKTLKVGRYLKYGFPLFGKFNRIRGLVVLAWKRQLQRYQAQKAKRARQLLWESKPRKVREVDAAIIIQSVFRARQARKAVKAMRILKADKEYLAISRIQHVLRRKLREQRARLEARQKELERLEQLMEEQTLSDKQKRRIYQLRHRVLKETNEFLNRKMLIRPNTKFSVYWKLFFAICLLWEFTGAALQPLVHKKPSKSHKSSKGDVEPTTVEELIARTFVPIRISDWPQCQNSTKDDSDKQQKKNGEQGDTGELRWYCKDPFFSTHKSARDALALALIPKPVSEWSECRPKPIPKKRRFPLFRRTHPREAVELDLEWYCGKPYSRLHQLYRNLVDWFWSEFVVLVGVAYFLDVFVTFFTGEFHPLSGVLLPKPFFARWILPGLVLQLAVNPYLKTVSGWTSFTLRHITKLGPVRVYRWNATVLLPLLFFVWRHSIQPMWLSLVEFENKHDLIPDDALF
ncbi:unnamed protein product [Cylindrotheca closterium]|uniref:Uncharacterized protein n=1 Tax=Cylindrotheca closterium TaxID=2856 RepID=A0AAD2FVV4_9STRA|nr:unnamed protein product [Cylindrotheca closterium]